MGKKKKYNKVGTALSVVLIISVIGMGYFTFSMNSKINTVIDCIDSIEQLNLTIDTLNEKTEQLNNLISEYETVLNNVSAKTQDKGTNTITNESLSNQEVKYIFDTDSMTLKEIGV